MSDSHRLPGPPQLRTPPAFSARLVARHLPQRTPHADVTALVRATLEELRRSETALETQLCDLRHYLGAAGLRTPSPCLA